MSARFSYLSHLQCNVCARQYMAAYAARARVPAYVVAAEDPPEAYIQQARLYTAEVELVAGLISDTGRVAANVAQQR